MLKFVLLIIISLFIVNSLVNNKRLINKNILKEKNVIILNMNSCDNHALLNNNGLPSFSKFDNNQVEEDINQILETLEVDFKTLENKISTENDINNLYNLAIEEMERIEYPLSFAWGLTSHLHSVRNNDELEKYIKKYNLK